MGINQSPTKHYKHLKMQFIIRAKHSPDKIIIPSALSFNNKLCVVENKGGEKCKAAVNHNLQGICHQRQGVSTFFNKNICTDTLSCNNILHQAGSASQQYCLQLPRIFAHFINSYCCFGKLPKTKRKKR